MGVGAVQTVGHLADVAAGVCGVHAEGGRADIAQPALFAEGAVLNLAGGAVIHGGIGVLIQ